GELDRLADAYIGSAAADVAAHGIVDVGIGRVRLASQQRRGGHDLSRLAVAALDDFMIEPGLLDPGSGSRPASTRPAHPLDRRYLRAADAVDRGDAGTGGDTVDVHGAGPTMAVTPWGRERARSGTRRPVGPVAPSSRMFIS